MSADTYLEELIGKMTVAEVAKLTGLSVGELIARLHLNMLDAAITPPAALNGAAARHASSGKSQQPGSKPRTTAIEVAAPTLMGPNVDTRSAEGRTRYDNAILGMLAASKHGAQSAELRHSIGGTAAQMRRALERLVGQQQVIADNSQGRTRYRIATRRRRF